MKEGDTGFQIYSKKKMRPNKSKNNISNFTNDSYRYLMRKLTKCS